MIGDESIAEEVIQDAFLIAHRKIHDFRGDSAVYTWLYRIVANLCLKRKSTLNRQRVQEAFVDMEYYLDHPSQRTQGQMEIDGWKNNPEREHLHEELIKSIRSECHFFLTGLLSDSQRLVFLLRRHENLSFSEIGDILEITENAAKSRFSRAKDIIERDLRTRCSMCNANNTCTCDECARYVVNKNPGILEKIRNKGSSNNPIGYQNCLTDSLQESGF